MACKPTVKDIFDYINEIAPFGNQCEWDNSGLLIGNKNKTVNKIGVVLDVTAGTAKNAVAAGVDLIISHHPVIFTPVKNFLSDSPGYILARNDIAVISAHTSLDTADGGVNDVLAETLGFKNPQRLTPNGEESLVRVCKIESTTASALAKSVADKLKGGVKYYDSGKEITTVALCAGAGKDFLHAAADSGCDAYITSEIPHHLWLEAESLGITVIDAGHFETETPVIPAFTEKLRSRFEIDVEIINQQAPVKYIF